MTEFVESLEFWYKNYRGEVSKRSVIPESIYWGSTDWHPKEQWLLKATDLEKGEERIFAMADIQGSLLTHRSELKEAHREGWYAGYTRGVTTASGEPDWSTTNTFAALKLLDPNVEA